MKINALYSTIIDFNRQNLYNKIRINQKGTISMKRRIYKQIMAGILGIILLLSLAGCGQSTSNTKPDETMKAFYDLIIKQDTSSITELGINKQEASDTLKTYKTSMVSTIQKSFKSAGVAITKEQATDIFEAISNKLSSLDYDITVQKQDKKTATVKISCQNINYLDIFKEAKQTTLNELKPLHIEKLSDAKKQLVSNVIEGFNSASISDDMHSQTFQLSMQKIKSDKNTLHIFFPKNYETVGSKLIKLTTNQ